MGNFKLLYIRLFLFLAGCLLWNVETVQNSYLFKRFEKDRKYSSSLFELERKSLAECAAICEQTDECLSLNYNKTQQQCHITDSYPSEGIKDVLIEQVLGWEIYYKQNPACEFSYTTYFATEYVNTITSPNYPNNYNNYVNQRWLIIKPRVTSTLYLDFTDFKLEDDHDHVYVYNGACLDAPNHANVTANTRYITYSSGLYALVNFKSDYSITFRGFSMDFYVGNN